MGCCLSTSNSSSPTHHSAIAQPTPLEPLESVKEVLSETPKPKPKPLIPIHHTELISHLSDVSSFTETLSTTTVTERLDDCDEIPHRISRSPAKLPNKRSLSDDWVPRRDRSVGKSPTRKSDHSPCRINSGAVKKLVQNRDMEQGLARRSLKPETRLQSRTESPYRRSKSPATTRTGGVVSRTAGGRSPSVRRSGISPGRDYYRREAAQALASKKESIEGKWQTNESIDNPLVSLECFIFL